MRMGKQIEARREGWWFTPQSAEPSPPRRGDPPSPEDGEANGVEQSAFLIFPFIHIGEGGSPFLGWDIMAAGLAVAGSLRSHVLPCFAGRRPMIASTVGLTRVPVALASWSAVVLNRFWGGGAEVFGGPLLLGIGAPTRKAPEDWSTPRRYRAQGGLSRGRGMTLKCRPCWL